MDHSGRANVFEARGPIVGIPPWWRSFLFHLLNGRQLSVYLYLLTLMGDEAQCSPTTRQIAADLGLMGATMVFDAIKVLEEHGFILRSRTAASESGARRNLYRRPSCEYTLLQLLSSGRVNADDLSDDALEELIGAQAPSVSDASGAERALRLTALLERRSRMDGRASTA